MVLASFQNTIFIPVPFIGIVLAPCKFKNLLQILPMVDHPLAVSGQLPIPVDPKECCHLAVHTGQKISTGPAQRQCSAELHQTVFIRVEPFRNFYTAEEYHQNYDLKNPEAFEKELIESGRK